MPITTQTSLFEPSTTSPMASSVSWINSVLFGEIALVFCVLAVAFLGALMLTGRLPLRGGLRVLLGCFVLLCAPVVVSGFMAGSNYGIVHPEAPLVAEPREADQARDLQRSDYDPYAGVSATGPLRTQ